MNLLILIIFAILGIIIINSKHFYKGIAIMATLILIVILLLMGYSLNKFKHTKRFPPVIANCPDYWISDSSGCSNPKNLGTLTNSCTGPMDFDTDHYNNATGHCKKSEWAKNCSLTWQGITTNDDICNESAVFDIKY